MTEPVVEAGAAAACSGFEAEVGVVHSQVDAAAAVAARSGVDRRLAAEAAGSSRWAPHRRAGTERGSVQSVVRADQGAGTAASQGPVGVACRANQVPLGVAAVSSPGRFCLIGVTKTGDHW